MYNFPSGRQFMTFCFGSKERVVGFKFTEMLTTEIPQSFGPSPPIKRSFFVVVYGFVSPPNPRRFVIVCDRNVMEGKVIGTLQVDGVGSVVLPKLVKGGLEINEWEKTR